MPNMFKEFRLRGGPCPTCGTIGTNYALYYGCINECDMRKPKVETPKEEFEIEVHDNAPRVNHNGKPYHPDAVAIYNDVGVYPKHSIGDRFTINTNSPFMANLSIGDIVEIVGYNIGQSRVRQLPVYDVKSIVSGVFYFVGEKHLGSGVGKPSSLRNQVEAKVGNPCIFEVGDRVRVRQPMPDGACYYVGDLIYITGYLVGQSGPRKGAAYYTNRIGDTGDKSDLDPYWVTSMYLELHTKGNGTVPKAHTEALLIKAKGLSLPYYSIGDKLIVDIDNPNGTSFDKGDTVLIVGYAVDRSLSVGVPAYYVSITGSTSGTWVQESYLRYKK